jgi:hypothetical protein
MTKDASMRPFVICTLLAAFALGASLTPQQASAQQVSVNFQVFYDALSPYGMWVDHPEYGYVWIPDREPGFSPYATGGYWVYTEDGWTWVSDYPWGWAPFHYGRWDNDPRYGWFWVPGDEWGPAWVSWRRSPGYYGWAPMRPGISISIAFGRDYRERDDRWIFVRDGDINRTDVSRRYIDRNRNAAIIGTSTVIPNTRRDDKRNVTFMAGPEKDEVQRTIHEPVKPLVIRDNDRPGHQMNAGELRIYRPQLQKRDGNERAPAPSKVMQPRDIRPAAGNGRAPRAREVKPLEVNTPASRPLPARREAVPAATKEKQKQPQKVVAPKREAQPRQPEGSQGEKEKKNREKQP